MEAMQYHLNPLFTVSDCTFICGEELVLFSPANRETMLCNTSLLPLLHLLENKTNTNNAIIDSNDEQDALDRCSPELINKLISMEVIAAYDKQQ